jgi:hypothetical protein
MAIADLWIKAKSVDYIWIILGNELSLHLPYIQLYEHVKDKPSAEQYIPSPHDLSYEAFSSFLISANPAEGVAGFNFSKLTEIIAEKEREADRPLMKPELLGVSLAEYYYKKYFLNKI